MTRLFSFIAGVLAVLIAGLVVMGDQTYPRVVAMIPADGMLSPASPQILISFSRDMDRRSVEEGFMLKPEVPGTFSWIGRRMAFTPSVPLDYGMAYHLRLEARDRRGTPLPEPYEIFLRTHGREMLFVREEANGRRIVQAKLTAEGTMEEVGHITPEHLSVLDYRIADGGALIIFSAVRADRQYPTPDLESYQEIYSLDMASGRVALEVDNRRFSNSQFAVSSDGDLIAIDRMEITHDGIFVARHLWLKNRKSGTLEKFWYQDIQPDVIFFAPQGTHLLSLDNLGFLVVPVDSRKGRPEYVGSFSNTHGFDRAGKYILFTDFPENSIFADTADLKVLDYRGELSLLVEGRGYVDMPRFNISGDTVYFLMKPVADETLHIGMSLWSIDAQTMRLRQIMADSQYSETDFDVSGDGRYVLLARVRVANNGRIDPAYLDQMTASQAGAYGSPELWLYDGGNGVARDLKARGSMPRWLYE